MPSENAQRMCRKDAKTCLETTSSDPNEDATSQTEPVASTLESEEKPDSEKLSIEHDIVEAYHRLEFAKSRQADANEATKACRKELDRLIRKLVAYNQPLPLFDKPQSSSNDGNTDLSGMSPIDVTAEYIRRMDEKYGILSEPAGINIIQNNTESDVETESDSDSDSDDSVNMAEYQKTIHKKSKRRKA